LAAKLATLPATSTPTEASRPRRPDRESAVPLDEELEAAIRAQQQRAEPAYRSKEVRIISRVGFWAPRTYTLMSILLNPGTECG